MFISKVNFEMVGKRNEWTFYNYLFILLLLCLLVLNDCCGNDVGIATRRKRNEKKKAIRFPLVEIVDALGLGTISLGPIQHWNRKCQTWKKWQTMKGAREKAAIPLWMLAECIAVPPTVSVALHLSLDADKSTAPLTFSEFEIKDAREVKIADNLKGGISGIPQLFRIPEI